MPHSELPELLEVEYMIKGCSHTVLTSTANRKNMGSVILGIEARGGTITINPKLKGEK